VLPPQEHNVIIPLCLKKNFDSELYCAPLLLLPPQENNAIIVQHEMVDKVVEIVTERQDMASSLRVRAAV
jgi:hypothetical protein